ncbi:MAG TPA: hypothetical protein VF421_06320 [Niabella sp.]
MNLFKLFNFAARNEEKCRPEPDEGHISLKRLRQAQPDITVYAQTKLFPFLEDGAGNCYWVDLNSGTRNEGQIFWTNTFGQNPDYLYHSLTNLFYTIAEGYEAGLFSLDAEHYLSLDYDKFDKLSARHNPELLYWQDK